jgi:hypothetical protein
MKPLRDTFFSFVPPWSFTVCYMVSKVQKPAGKKIRFYSFSCTPAVSILKGGSAVTD